MPVGASGGHAGEPCSAQRCPPPASRDRIGGPSSSVVIEPCPTLERLSEVRAALRKLEHHRNFLKHVFEERDKQIFPRDLLVASLPSKRAGRAGRPVGILRRSLKYDKERGSHLCIDFVWVMKECRGNGVGRRLLLEGLQDGRPKPVRLMVAGSENNFKAVGLYESLGFCWTCKLKADMMLGAEQVVAALDTAKKAAEVAAEATADAEEQWQPAAADEASKPPTEERVSATGEEDAPDELSGSLDRELRVDP